MSSGVENHKLLSLRSSVKKIPNMPPKGRPPKKKRNISGLKNQPSRSNAPLESITESNPPDLDDDSHENAFSCQNSIAN